MPGKEALLFQDIPTVVTASRQSLTVLESPATATIITREDIEHMGYNSVTKLIRFVTGIDFFQSTGASFNVGMRGVNGLQANNVLVLIDGRPIFSPTRNTNQCALIPEVPDDIERVEIIRGPGSVLYGSNAFSGVINIITRSPEAISGTRLTASVGTFNEALYSLTSGNKFGPWSYKLISAWTQKSSVNDHNNQIKGLLKIGGELGYEFRPGNELNFSFGFSKGRINVKPSATVSVFDQDGFDGFLRGTYKKDELKFDLWWRHFEASGDFEQSGHLRWRYDNINFLFQDLAHIDRHTLVYGFEGRIGSLGATSYDKWHNQFLGSVFIEDRWHLSSETNVFTGLRIDYHTEAKVAVSPRISIVHFLGTNKSIRFTAATAFKYPSYLQNYIDMNYSYFRHSGNVDLDPENLTSLELAYQLINPTGFSCTIATFFNNYSDIIDYDFSIKNRKFYLTYDNLYSMHQYGVELEGSYRFSPNFLIKANYSYVWKQKKDGMTFGPVPTNQINGEIRYDLDVGLWFDFRIHWQDTADCFIGLSPSNFSTSSFPVVPSRDMNDVVDIIKFFSKWHEIDGYVLGDLSLGYKPPHKPWEFAFAIHNIFHERFKYTESGPRADTTITARFSMKF